MILGGREWLYLDVIRQTSCDFYQLLILSGSCGMSAGQCQFSDDTVYMFIAKLAIFS